LAASTRLIALAGIEDVVFVLLLKDVLLEDVLPEDVVLEEDVVLDVVVPVGVGTKIEEGVAIGIDVVGVMGFTGVDVGGLPISTVSTGMGVTGIGVTGV
jgi:hypothetical protein